jgi:hypothetical protein
MSRGSGDAPHGVAVLAASSPCPAPLLSPRCVAHVADARYTAHCFASSVRSAQRRGWNAAQAAEPEPQPALPSKESF